jgi:hypothetical protein
MNVTPTYVFSGLTILKQRHADMDGTQVHSDIIDFTCGVSTSEPIQIVLLADSGTTLIGNGNNFVQVAFSAPIAGNWSFTRLVVINTTDPNPLNIFPGTVTAQSANGFLLQLNGAVDSGNYQLAWRVEVRP